MDSSISSKARECVKLFAQITGFSNRPDEYRSENARFDKWYRNTGAHQKGSSSLDQRLQDASHIRDVVVELLDGLIDSLLQVIELLKTSKNPKISASELSHEELQDSIHIIISSLLKLAIAVRNPAPFDRYVKSRAIDMSFYKVHDLAYIEEMFPGIDRYLKERMAEATLQRRRFLEYSARHHYKLARDSSPEESEEDGIDSASLYAETNASSLPLPLRLELSTIENQFEIPPDTRSERSSFTSYASSGMGIRPKIPPPPFDAVLGGDPFECPYCHLLISPQDTYNWRKHVFHDLQPYVCTFEHCEKQDHLFGSRHEWFDHELTMHRREWVCPGHCDEVFTSQKNFEIHLAANYADAGASLPALIKTCERPLLPSASAHCPFCLENVTSRKNIRNHIGQHLADISLRVLPTTIEETESSEDEVHDESTDSEHTTVGNETAGRDLLDNALKDLISRVEDWKTLDVNSLGNLLLHGVSYIAARGIRKQYVLYLFSDVLLCCRPTAITKEKKKWYRRDKNKSSEAKKPMLQLRGTIFISTLTNVMASYYTSILQISWKGDTGVESFDIDFKDENKVPIWRAAIEQQFKAYKEKQQQDAVPLRSHFAWMEIDNLTPKSAIAIVPPLKVIRALFDYEAQSYQELSFQKGDFFHVIGRENDTDWYEACNPALPDARGLVPVAFFQALGKTERSERTTMDPLRQGSTTIPLIQLEPLRSLVPVTATSTSPSPLPPYPTPIVARVQCQGNYVTLVISTNVTYQSLIDRIDAKVGRFSINSIVKGTLKLRYCDDDGDNVNISNDDDLQLALNEVRHRPAIREASMEGRLGEVDFSCIDC